MSEELQKGKKKKRKKLFSKIDLVIDKLIAAQNLEDDGRESEANNLIKEAIKDCQEIVNSIEFFSEDKK